MKPKPESKQSRLSWIAAMAGVAGVLGIYSWNLWASPAFGLLADQPYHLHFAEEFERAWRDGEFPPRWAAGANGGRGSVGFVVYPPFVAFLTACWMHLGASATEALRLMVVTVTAGVVASVTYLARAWLSWPRSLFAATLVLMLPGVTFIALGRGMFPHYAALAWAAFLLGAGQRAILGRRVHLNSGLALIAAVGLVLTHTLTAFLLFLSLLAVSPMFAKALGIRGMARATAIAAVAASLTCWYWLPLLQVGSYARVDYLAASHPYLDSVFGAAVQDPDGVFRQDWVFLNDLGRYIIAAQSLLAFVLALILRSDAMRSEAGSERRDYGRGDILFQRVLPWVAGFALLAATGFGARLLLELPGAAFIQFSWRWQLLVSLWCGVALAGLPWEPKSAPAAVLALATVLFFSPLLSVSEIQPHDQRRDLPSVLSKSQFDRLQPLDRAAYAGNLLEQRPNRIDTHYYLPDVFGRTEVLSGQASVTARVLNTSYREYLVAAATDTILQIKTYHAPGWSARLNQEPVEVRMDCHTGLQLISVPAGSHRLELQYRVPRPW